MHTATEDGTTQTLRYVEINFKKDRYYWTTNWTTTKRRRKRTTKRTRRRSPRMP
jgi:hypothetical protein